MYPVPGTPVNINGRTGGSPGPAATTPARIAIPMPPGRAKKLANGNAPLAPSTTFARYLRIANTDATNDLKVSLLDDTFVTITKGTSAEFSGYIPFFTVQASAGTTQWEAFAIVAA